ncbi:GLUG motif-containing protein [Teredinibacter turnerae]|uniref:GLUG motif-containing protein n=1 Tax=Teredinibacter turnerae TaxID=2426 RepID=UPI000363A964|nr:GLUG motif-containing protein [Teredinibacter turnerae]
MLRIPRTVLPLALLLLSSTLHAENNRTDYDLDDDGLIEINDLQDLNEIRNHLNGAALYGSSDGCPDEGCVGFELTTDLNFDTNGDGVLDAADTYWNEGEGWVAIESFQAIFDGNGHTISNLMINRPSSNYQGLFGVIVNAQIHNIALRGPLTSVTGSSRVGALAGYASNSTISQVIVTGDITGVSDSPFSAIGGLLGYTNNVQLNACFFAGDISAQGGYVGGLIGEADSTSISDCMTSGSFASERGYRIGMLVGDFRSNTNSARRNLSNVAGDPTSLFGNFSSGSELIANYWHTESSSRSSDASGTGASLSELQCPLSADNSDCASVTLYAGWAAALTPEGDPRWDFGSATQLPGIRINGVVYRDNDGDGSLDSDDAYPNNPAASRDSDGDGAPDSWNLGCDAQCRDASGLTLDQVPQNSAAIVDADLDGLPETWTPGCDASCQSASGLTLDDYPNDSDNDGIPNTEDTDDNNDGVPDADADSDGLIEIHNWAELDAIRYSLQGLGRRLSEDGGLDASGCPTGVVDGYAGPACHGYELVSDLNFDTNGDGVLDASDTYWNEGQGWVAIGTYSDRFRAVFDGHGHTISNLMINRPSSDAQGLFGVIDNAQIHNIALRGPLTSVTGKSYVGGLAGAAYNSTISQVIVTGDITGVSATTYVYIGGLVGYTNNVQLNACFFAGDISGQGGYVGGLIGRAYSNTSISDCTASGSVASESTSKIGMLVGNFGSTTNSARRNLSSIAGDPTGVFGDFYPSELIANYWQTESSSRSSAASGTGASLSELQCPLSADNSDCASVTTDGDRTGDNADVFPNDATETTDSDGDGTGDNADAFPNDATETTDTDGDGTGDNADVFPNDATETTDSDGDGIGNNTDTDDDNDGLPDEQDPELGVDNGIPVVSVVPNDITLFDNGQPLMVTLLATEVAANDAVDTHPEVIAMLNGEKVTLDGDTEVAVPCGSNTVSWYAEDAAGNRSEPVAQMIHVYPAVSFEETDIVTGENSSVSVTAKLSCVSPSYPIHIEFTAGDETTISADDFENFEMPTELVFDGETTRISHTFEWQVLSDMEDEDEEILVLNIASASVDIDGSSSPLNLLPNQKTLSLRVVDTNLPPSVTIEITQQDVPADIVNSTLGDVTVSAIVTDPNGDDTHTFNWELSDLGLVIAADQASFSFDPNNLQDGDYAFKVTVTDSGEPALSDSEDSVLTIETPVEPTEEPSPEPTSAPTPLPSVEPSTAPTAEPTVVPSTTPSEEPTPAPTSPPAPTESSGSSGGGGSTSMWVLILLGLALGRRKIIR